MLFQAFYQAINTNLWCSSCRSKVEGSAGVEGFNLGCGEGIVIDLCLINLAESHFFFSW